MILDRLEEASKYRTLLSELTEVFDYLRQTDFSRLANGRHELDGDRLFVIVQRYRPKPLAEIVWESHRQYIDVQYVVAGAERMGCTSRRDDSAVLQPYDPRNDVILYRVEGDLFEVRAGCFAVFTPDDIHAPGLAIDPSGGSEEVCKVVVKKKIENIVN